MKKKLCVIGHFSFNNELLNGQTIKTKIITTELETQFGDDEVVKIDTCRGKSRLLSTIFRTFNAMLSCKNVIMLPAQNGLKFFAPLLCLFKTFSKSKLHYIVIGGWLAEFIQNKPTLTKCLKKFDAIYVETNAMKQSLEKIGFDNIFVMPNCKELNILSEDELVYPVDEPLKLCTFSRVMKEKGIEDAVNAVKTVNSDLGKTAFCLDIYGQIDENQKEWFAKLSESFPDYVKYGGLVPYNESVNVLKNYFALLFPTHYDGEGFAGTIIDAYAAGVPVLASNWKYNSEVVDNNVTGIIYNNLPVSLLGIYKENIAWNNLKGNCLLAAHRFLPNNVLKILSNNLQ